MTAVVGCVVDDQPYFDEVAISCNGKCDGLSTIRTLIHDPSLLDLGDLVSIGAGFATDELNDAMAYRGVAAAVGAPQVYALPERADDDLTLHDIDELVTGLASRYGETELTTTVNALRAEHLRTSGDTVYAEGSFRLSASYDPTWRLPANGFEDLSVWLGFGAGGALETRVIAPFRSEIPANGEVMLRALRETRGFIAPRSVDDIRLMAPGETFALRGAGHLAVNLGVGVPLLIVEPLEYLTYSLVFTAALRARLEGQLDVQLVRLGGEEVVIDVGMEQARARSFRVAVEDGWGVQGLINASINVAGRDVDLGSIAERALESRLNSELNLISAHAETSRERTRVSVARFRFYLDRASEEATQAMAQALRGDVRLAQALANRGDPGVVAEFDLLRSGVSTVSHAGIDLFGMSFFTTRAEREGSVVVQTPGGARSYLFNSLHEEAGWFFSSHGYTRVGLAGLTFDPQSPGAPRGETNLFVQLEEGDDYMQRDKMVDHLDALLLAIGGQPALDAVEVPGNEIERYVNQTCRGRDNPWDECFTRVLSDPYVVTRREAAHAALEGFVRGLDPSLRQIAMSAGDLRVIAQETHELGAGLEGPPTSIVIDYRLDEGALAQLMVNGTGRGLEDALRAYLLAVEIDRSDPVADIAADRARLTSNSAQTLATMASVFDTSRDQYERLLAAESASIAGLGTLGGNALQIRFPVDSRNRVLFDQATTESLSQARARVVMELFDTLRVLAKGPTNSGTSSVGDGYVAPQPTQPPAIGHHPEQIVGYALLAMVPADRIDLRVDLDMSTEDNWAQPFDHYRAAGYETYEAYDAYARGPLVAPISGGVFNVDALINVSR